MLFSASVLLAMEILITIHSCTDRGDTVNDTPLINILAVDDRPENLLALENLLEAPGRALFKAASGNEALGMLMEHEFALVLLDVQMPE